MMPPPTHLEGWVVPDSDVVDEDHFAGNVQCPCGCDTFEVSHPGGTYKTQGVELPCTAEVNGKYFFLVQVKCTACGAEKVIFDADFHGWEGFVAHNKRQGKLPRPNLAAWLCNACGGKKHTVRLGIDTNGKQDFVAETGGRLPKERWMDAFSWIDIDIQCAECHAETKSWVSYETM